jgi:hypothetical protein
MVASVIHAKRSTSRAPVSHREMVEGPLAIVGAGKGYEVIFAGVRAQTEDPGRMSVAPPVLRLQLLDLPMIA